MKAIQLPFGNHGFFHGVLPTGFACYMLHLHAALHFALLADIDPVLQGEGQKLLIGESIGRGFLESDRQGVAIAEPYAPLKAPAHDASHLNAPLKTLASFAKRLVAA